MSVLAFQCLGYTWGYCILKFLVWCTLGVHNGASRAPPSCLAAQLRRPAPPPHRQRLKHRPRSRAIAPLIRERGRRAPHIGTGDL